MRLISVFVVMIFLCGMKGGNPLDGSDKNYEKALKKHRKHLHKEFKNPETSPLKAAAKDFKGLDYFPIDPTYKVSAKLEKTPDVTPFEMPTSDPKRNKHFLKYGTLTFTLNGETYVLSVYKSLQLAGQKKYEDYLFLPFKDFTNGRETYGGGRYLDMKTTDGDTVELDFNYCYNPYCAYSDGWSCPIPPEENHLPVAIEAGVKKYENH